MSKELGAQFAMPAEHVEPVKRQPTKLIFGDPTELPASMRRPLPNSAPAVSARRTRRPGAMRTREAVVYGSYIAQTWRLERCSSTVDQVRQAHADLANHVGVALVSGYRETILWQMVELECLAGICLPLHSVSERPRNVKIVFAAKVLLPGGAIIGRDVRTATKCYGGCREPSGNVGIFFIYAEEKRFRRKGWRERIDGSRALRCTGSRAHFYFAPWGSVSS